MTAYNMTTTSAIDAGVPMFFERTALSTPFPQYIMEKWADEYTIPKNNSTTWKARRYNRLSAATTKLAEGITPNGSKMSKVDLLATVDQYGDWVMITDVVELTTDGMAMAKRAEMQADQIRNTRDDLCKSVLTATASVVTCSNGAVHGAATYINRTDIDTVCKTLKGNLCEKMTGYMRAAQGQGTAPLRPAYIAIFNYMLRDNLMAVSGAVGTHQYPQQNFVDPNEWCSIGETRWVETTKTLLTGSYYQNIIFGKEAYAKIKLDSNSLATYVDGPGKGNDYLRQRSVAGWKMWTGYRIIQDLNIIDLRCTLNS